MKDDIVLMAFIVACVVCIAFLGWTLNRWTDICGKGKKKALNYCSIFDKRPFEKFKYAKDDIVNGAGWYRFLCIVYYAMKFAQILFGFILCFGKTDMKYGLSNIAFVLSPVILIISFAGDWKIKYYDTTYTRSFDSANFPSVDDTQNQQTKKAENNE